MQAFPWRFFLTLATVVVLAAGTAFFLKDCREESFAEARNWRDWAVAEARQMTENVAKHWQSGNVTHTFQESLPAIFPNAGDVLEVYSDTTPERFRKEDARSAAWGALYLGTTVTEISVPATFRYHIRISGEWRVEMQGNVYKVTAPPLEPSLPVAIQTDQMRTKQENGWARFDKYEALAALQQSVTPELAKRAMEPQRLEMVRNSARVAVGKFIERWLATTERWGEGKEQVRAVLVRFADEADEAGEPPSASGALPTPPRG